jgi:hypothetical protein
VLQERHELREGYGRALVASGRLPLAASEGDAVQQLASELLKSDSEDRRAIRLLSLSHALHARVWAAQRQTALADKASEQALSAIEPVARTSDDYTVLEVWALALLQLRRSEEALPALRKLQGMGYRNLVFLAPVRPGPARRWQQR